MTYELFYWPTIQGRGEFVRLALEQAGVEYTDVARSEGPELGVSAMLELVERKDLAHPSFAPPFLRDGDLVVGQTANILLYLGSRHGLAPRSERGRLWTHQVQLTIMDLVTEVHDTHHPVSVDLYYEDQKPEAARRAKSLRESRMPKYLQWFERILERNGKTGQRIGRELTYADLSLFQVVEGLNYSFPTAASRALTDAPLVSTLSEAVTQQPRIAAYLESDWRIPFSEDDVFRYYPELDG
jgi:glutathione S-transferase